ncbi:MAG: RNA-binding S4 domain-containing protein [Bacillota bacterium]
MRLDKFLKVSRLVKRRTVAKELCDAGRVTVNGRVAKAGHEVAPEDVLEIGYGSRAVRVRVLELRENASTEQARSMYQAL